MSRLCVFFVIGVMASSLLMPPLRAQTIVDEVHVSPRRRSGEISSSEEPPSKGRGKAIKVDVHLVLLPVTITDFMNRPVTGLEKDNFKVFEGKEQQDIRHFSGEDMPVSLGVIFDTSGSMNGKLDRAREAIVEFFKTANPQDEFFRLLFLISRRSCRTLRVRWKTFRGNFCTRCPKAGRRCWMPFTLA